MSLPPGLTLTPDGRLTGSPTTPGVYPVRVQVQDESFNQAWQEFQLTVNSGLTIDTASPLPDASEAVAYSQQLSASNSSGQVSWSLQQGSSLPAGLSLSPTGLLSGTPIVSGDNFTFTVEAADDVDTTAKQFTLSIWAALGIQNPAQLPDGYVGQAYSQQLVATNARDTITWAITSGALPDGLSLAGSGLISGTPTSSGSATVTIEATEANTARTVSRQFGITVASGLAITTQPSLPDAVVGQNYSQQLQASGNSGQVLWGLENGSSLPQGLILSPGGLLSGSPVVTGPAVFTITATDDTRTVSQQFTLVVISDIQITSPDILPDGEALQPYSEQLTTSGAVGSVLWVLDPASLLPPGILLEQSTGILSGTPTQAGDYTFTIWAADDLSLASKEFGLFVESALAITSPATLPGATVSQAYSYQLTHSGNTGPVTWALDSGTLPAGITLTGDTLSGTPTQAGVSNFQLTCQDTVKAVTQAFTLEVFSSLSIDTPHRLPNGSVGVEYSQQLQAAGAAGPLTWTLKSGTLPDGVTLSPDGILFGTPTAAGSHSPVIEANDTSTQVERTFELDITSALVITSPDFLPSGVEGQPYSFQFTATGGLGAVSWDTSSPIPPGLGLTVGGLLSGTPTELGTWFMEIEATDQSQTIVKTVGMAVRAAPPPPDTHLIPTFRSFILADPEVASLFGDRVYYLRFPQNALDLGPLIVFERQTSERTFASPLPGENRTLYGQTRFDVHVWAQRPEQSQQSGYTGRGQQLEALIGAVSRILDSVPNATFDQLGIRRLDIESTESFHETAPGLYRATVTVEVFHTNLIF